MATNNITGDLLKSRPASLDYLEGWDRIFGGKRERQSIRSSSDGSNVPSDAGNGIPGGDTDSINVLQDGGDQG